VSLLSFGVNPYAMAEAGKKTDSSQALSALLPFVVAATAIAALAQPSTFTWWVFWVYKVFEFCMWLCD
jgi:BASS family bile acid:Na+ symporter